MLHRLHSASIDRGQVSNIFVAGDDGTKNDLIQIARRIGLQRQFLELFSIVFDQSGGLCSQWYVLEG
jgi:hypothetical protein